jgi:hypothetical protein
MRRLPSALPAFSLWRATIFLLCASACSPIEPPVVDASALPDTTNIVGPYQVTARVQARRTIESVVLVWQDLSEPTVQAERVAMTENSSGVYVGEIPGYGAGAQIAYHVEATDSSGDTAADPTFGSAAQCGDDYCFNVLAQ